MEEKAHRRENDTFCVTFLRVLHFQRKRGEGGGGEAKRDVMEIFLKVY